MTRKLRSEKNGDKGEGGPSSCDYPFHWCGGVSEVWLRRGFAVLSLLDRCAISLGHNQG